MTKLFALAALAILALAGVSAAETPSDDPPECSTNAAGSVDYQACADAAAPGSAARALALINLGTQAYLRQDYADAVRYYDEAQPANGNRIFSDASFHAYRADAYQRVGRSQEALANAQIAWALLSHSAPLYSAPPALWAHLSSLPVDGEVVYALILPILRAGHDPNFERALSAYNALPAVDWLSYANRAALLEELDDLAGALRANAQALALQPDQPQVLNTQCYVLARLNRGADALPYCTRAIQLAPDIAAVHDSYAAALAVSGQCSLANHERAEAHRLDPVDVSYMQPVSCPSSNAQAPTH